MEIHGSMVTCYNTCPRMYRYRYVEGLVPKVESDKLWLGTGGHLALAAYYRGEDALGVYDSWVASELARLREVATSEQYEKLEQQAALGRELVEYYMAWARANDRFEVVEAEREFRVPLWYYQAGKWQKARGIVHAGRWDGVVRDVYGKYWLLEHKFYSQFPSESELRRDEQAGYYLVAASQEYDDVVGVIYTVIRKVSPARAKDAVIRRWAVLRNRNELRALTQRLYRAVQRIRADRYFDPTPGFHCGWQCAYPQLCIAEDDGSDVQFLIDNFYVREEGGWRYGSRAVASQN